MTERWTNEPDPPKPDHYRRIYDERGRSVARVYDPADAELIVMAPEMREFIWRVCQGVDGLNVDAALQLDTDARDLYRRAGGKGL